MKKLPYLACMIILRGSKPAAHANEDMAMFLYRADCGAGRDLDVWIRMYFI